MDSLETIVPPSILIVDDTPTHIKILLTILQPAGFTVFVARSGESALNQVLKVAPDLILLDIRMPGIDGFETCRRLKADPRSREIPVIFLSALDETADKLIGFAVGGVDYITKPFQPKEVLVRVENQLALQAAKSRINQLNQKLEKRVEQRTIQLAIANHELNQEIGERKKIEAALLKREEELRLMFDLAPIGMAIENLEGQFLRVNQSLCNILGYSSAELLCRLWTSIIHPDDLPAVLAMHEKLWQAELSVYRIENRCLAKEGQVVFSILQVTMVRDAAGDPLHLITHLIDITEQKQAEAQLLYGALHDNLTRLPNRSLLMERLELALKRTRRHENYRFAVLFIDLDRFKMVNDSLGHEVGDRLLMAIAQELSKLVRATDTVARLGGDEFVVLLDPITDLNHAIRIAERIAEVLRRPFQLVGREIFITPSIGITLSSKNDAQATDLLRNADIAMYRAKVNGRGRYEVFDQEMYVQVRQRLQLESELRQACERQEFQLYYQPIFQLATHQLIGFEALVRWLHPSRGVVLPAEFITVAEEMGLIIPLGEWVLKTACQQMQRWRTDLIDSLGISINLSLLQLKEPNFLATVDQILAQTCLPGRYLQLELTEGMLMDNAELLTETLVQLRLRQIELSVDGFGTGYSSLNDLHRLPLNHLKIAREFVHCIGTEDSSQDIVATIVTLAHQLGMSVVAEGIETPQQLEQLRALHCEAGQGYWFAQPLDQQTATAFIARTLLETR